VQVDECQTLQGVQLFDGTTLGAWKQEMCDLYHTPGSGCFYSSSSRHELWSTSAGCSTAAGYATFLAVCKKAPETFMTFDVVSTTSGWMPRELVRAAKWHLLHLSASDRSSFTWAAYPGFDLPDVLDAEVMDSSDVDMVKRACERRGYAGFVLCDGQAHLKASVSPFQQRDLSPAPTRSTIVFAFAPPPPRAWREFPNCDLPDQKDAEIVNSTDPDELMLHAERKAHAGFVLCGGPAAYMKASDVPLTERDLLCGVTPACTFYLPEPHALQPGLPDVPRK